MQFGLNLPNFEAFGDAQVLAQLAREAETAGWDAIFLWDHILFDPLPRPIVDPWVALTAMALSTERIRLGTMVTPLPRRRPWQVARQTTSLDRLSDGRLILCVGLGDPARWEYGFFGEETDERVRAQKLDEALDILIGLWSGEPFAYEGAHHQLQEMRFLPTPCQQPRIPIWVGGYWPRRPPFRRAARMDGVCPGGLDKMLTPDDWREILDYVQQHRTVEAPFDAVHTGRTPSNDLKKAAETVAPYAAVGVTWWIEDIITSAGMAWNKPWDPQIVDQLVERVRQGPPR